MVITFTWRIPLGGTSFSEASAAIEQLSEAMVRIRPSLLGCHIQPQGAGVTLTLRVTAHDRWRAAERAKKAMVALCLRGKLPWREGLMQSQVIEPTRRDLHEGQGRTVPPRPSRRARTGPL